MMRSVSLKAAAQVGYALQLIANCPPPDCQTHVVILTEVEYSFMLLFGGDPVWT